MIKQSALDSFMIRHNHTYEPITIIRMNHLNHTYELSKSYV